jgi:hypothetical protein
VGIGGKGKARPWMRADLFARCAHPPDQGRSLRAAADGWMPIQLRTI